MSRTLFGRIVHKPPYHFSFIKRPRVKRFFSVHPSQTSLQRASLDAPSSIQHTSHVSRMQDLDPASLLFIPRDEYAPLQLDPELFESVGDGVSLETFNIPKVTLPTTTIKSPSVAASDLLGRLKSLAAKLDPPNADESDILRGEGGGGHKSNRGRMGTTQSWEVACEQDLDQRVLEIDQPNIFDSFHTSGTAGMFDFQEPSTSPVSSEQGTGGPEVDSFAEWDPRTATDSPSHPAGQTSSPIITKETLNQSFDLPVLSKRPRNILDDCVLRDQNPIATTTHKHHQQPTTQNVRAGKVAKTQSPKSRVGTKEDLAETWRAAGKPVQDDLTGSTAHGKRGARIREQLRWETCSKSGFRTESSHLAMSPYVTEAGTTTFESVYQRYDNSQDW